MLFHEVFQPFINQSPISVMFRGTLENVFSSERLDRLFETTAVRQRTSPVLFSTCANLFVARSTHGTQVCPCRLPSAVGRDDFLREGCLRKAGWHRTRRLGNASFGKRQSIWPRS